MAKNGFSLIEVLVSLFLLSFIFLSFNAVELYSLHETRASYQLHLGTRQMDEIAERLHALGVRNGLSSQILIWNAHNAEVLPKGRGSVSGRFPVYTITLTWGKRHSLKETIDVQKSLLETHVRYSNSAA